MRFIDNQNISDPALNLALEEHCYRSLDPRHEYVLFYINAPSIVFGNHQNPFQEINLELADKRNIRSLRRISGGGAVYHDGGNLNFSFITKFGPEKLNYFKKLLQPILATLKRLGLPVELGDKNNILCQGQKISGNSQHANMRRMLSHGTLLYNAQLDTLHQVLQSRLQIIQSRAVASIPSSVINIADCLSRPMGIDTLTDELKAGIAHSFGELTEYQLTAADWQAIRHLAEEKYRSWNWTIGRTPEFIAKHKIQIDATDVEVHVRVKNAIIEEIKPSADQPFSERIQPKFANLIGRRYDPLHTKSLQKNRSMRL